MTLCDPLAALAALAGSAAGVAATFWWHLPSSSWRPSSCCLLSKSFSPMWLLCVCASTSLPGSAATFATSAFCSVAANGCSDLASLASLMKNVVWPQEHRKPTTTLKPLWFYDQFQPKTQLVRGTFWYKLGGRRNRNRDGLIDEAEEEPVSEKTGKSWLV